MIEQLQRANLSHTQSAGIKLPTYLSNQPETFIHSLTDFSVSFFTRTLAEMNIEPTPIDTKGFQALVQLVNTF